jgi:hypothetical protein
MSHFNLKRCVLFHGFASVQGSASAAISAISADEALADKAITVNKAVPLAGLVTIFAFCLSITATSVLANPSVQPQAAQSAKEPLTLTPFEKTRQAELELGRQYLQCTMVWAMAPTMIRMSGSEPEAESFAQLREANRLAANVLLGEQLAEEENDEQKRKFIQDINLLGAGRALEKWTERCGVMFETTFEALLPRIEAYKKLKATVPA